jgi:hypothetical protein
VKWVEDNLGISRKALRGFEEVGLMPKNTGHRYRDYDEDDIDRIWKIRVFQGMGFTLKEIASMVNDEKFSFDDLIGQKIEELEKEKLKVEMHLGYAKTIKLTGRFPLRPRKMGEMKFEKFQQDALERWNINDDPQEVEYAKLVDTILSKSVEEWEKSDLGRMISVLEMIKTMDTDLLIAEHVLPKAICKRKALGVNHPDIQLMVKLIYENENALYQSQNIEGKMSIKQFSRFYSSSFLVGDIAKIKTSEYTEEDCEFIAEAVSVFGGYKNYDELLEDELRHGRRDEGGEENE